MSCCDSGGSQRSATRLSSISRALLVPAHLFLSNFPYSWCHCLYTFECATEESKKKNVCVQIVCGAQWLLLLPARINKASFISLSIPLIRTSVAEWETNIFMTCGETHFSEFKKLLFPIIIISFSCYSSCISQQLQKDLIGIQLRGGGSNLFWGGRMSPTHLQPPPHISLPLAEIPHRLGCDKCQLNNLWCHDLTKAAENSSKEKRQKAGILSFYYFFFNLSFFSSKITYKW